MAAAGKNTNRVTFLDGAGVVAGYSYDPADRLTATTQSGYTGAITYDGHGNTTAVGGQTLYYDQTDRHQATTRQTVTATYQRDVTDRIVARTSGSTGLIKYAHTGAGDATDAVLDSSGNVVQRLIPLPGGVIYTKKTAGGATWSYPNIHGDIALTTDGAGAVTSGPHTYDPYGNNLTPAGSAPNNVNGQLDYRWVGQHQRLTEGETPLRNTIHMGARPYDTTLARFLETDPIEAGSANPYDYTSGDPINSQDLDGQVVCARMGGDVEDAGPGRYRRYKYDGVCAQGFNTTHKSFRGKKYRPFGNTALVVSFAPTRDNRLLNREWSISWMGDRHPWRIGLSRLWRAIESQHWWYCLCKGTVCNCGNFHRTNGTAHLFRRWIRSRHSSNWMVDELVSIQLANE